MNPAELPERVRIVGTVERVNRQAAAVGQNGKIRAAKGVIQLKKVSENHWQLWVSVAKDLDGQRYDIDKVQRLRTNFIDEGKLTIEFSQPPFSVMLRDCKPQELNAIVESIRIIKKGDSRLKAVADSIEEKVKHKAVDKPSQNAKDGTGRSAKIVPGSSSKSVPSNSSKSILGSSSKSASESFSKIVPGSLLKSAPCNSPKDTRGCSSKAVSGSSSKIVPGNLLKSAPSSSPKDTPGCSSKAVLRSSSKTVPGGVLKSGPCSSPKDIPGSSSKNIPTSSPKSFHELCPENTLVEEQKPVRSGIKRPLASEDMPKKEARNILKSLKLATGCLVISDRSNYPLRGFPPELKRLTCNNLLLRKIDYKLQDLLHLKSLSLPNNKISSIDMLMHMKSQLEIVNFANNQIERIGEDVFRAKAFMRLKVLNLSSNQIRCLPNSVLELPELMELHMSNNALQVLPYNLHRLNSLILLKIDGNRLRALPSPISLMKLNFLDISTNPFPHINVLAGVKKRVQLEPAVTLFEKAGTAFLSHQQSRRVSYSHRYDPCILPKIITEFLSSAKYCRQCGKMCLRYLISYQSSSQPLAQEFVRYTREYPVCLIRCDKCSRNEF